MKPFKLIWILSAALAAQWSSARADDVITNVMSPIVSYQYPNDLGSEALTNGGLLSPIASYQYFEWPDDSILRLQSSPLVSYFYLSGVVPPGALSSSSQVTVSPSSVPADGQSHVTVKVTLIDGNGTPVAGKTITVSAVEHSLGLVGSLSTISQPAQPTDAKGQATATLTSTVAGTAIISVQDVTDGATLVQQPVVQFTSALVPPRSDLSQAIAALYDNTVSSFSEHGIVGTHAATYGDQFRAYLTADEAGAVLDAMFGVISTVMASGDTLKYASDLALPGLAETGTKLVMDSSTISRLFDTELLNGSFTRPVLKAAFKEVALEVVGEDLAEDVTDYGITTMFEQLASQVDGLSQLNQKVSDECHVFQQSLQRQEQALLNQGIPPLTDAQQTAWVTDLQLRGNVWQASLAALEQQVNYLNQLSVARQFGSGETWELIVAKFCVEAAATIMFDGPGALVTGGILTLAEEAKDLQAISVDRGAYNTAFSTVSGSLQYDGQEYLNAVSAYNEILQGQPANPVTGQIVGMSDVEEGYISYAPLHLWSSFNATKGYSLVDVKNTSHEDATFEVIVLWGFPSTDWGISIPALSQESFSVLRVPAQTDSQIQVTYYDGQNGGKPDPSTPMVAYVLGNNSSGTFYIDKLVHKWSPSQVAMGGGNAGGLKPKDLVPDNENPVTTYITPDATNQSYRARVFVVNPYGQQYSAVVTQTLPAGAVVLATDGAVLGTSLVWTNLIPGGAVAMDSFTFQLSVGPGASTNLPPSTAVFVDETNNAGSVLTSVVPAFTGVFPVQASATVPGGITGADVPMIVVITNWTSTNQVGFLSVVVTNSAGAQVLRSSVSFSVSGSAGTNIQFVLPGTFQPGSYSLVGTLSINGGTKQFVSGAYVVPVPPTILSLDSEALSTTNGFTMVLRGPPGFSFLVEASTNLVDWTPIQYFTSTNPAVYCTDFVSANWQSRFYRAMAVAP